MNKVILAFGAHPDDVEIGVFGTLTKHFLDGDKIIIVDLTQGEMGSNGTPQIRKEEARNAASLIQAERINLELPDRGLKNEPEQIRKIVKIIRQVKADVLLYPYHRDYHPDHEIASQMLKEAWHFSGLPKYETGEMPHRPKKVGMYYINDIENPNVYVDISEAGEIKKRALEAHRSQFESSINGYKTYLNQNFIEKVITRDRYYGNLMGVELVECLHMTTLPVHSTIWELTK